MHVPVIGDITITEYSKASVLVQGTCSLYQISGATCGQSDLDCKYSTYAKAFQKGLQNGKCADQGYTKQTGTKTINVPVIGDITVTEYSKASMMVEDTCSLYQVSGDTCGQSDLDCKYTKYAKAFHKGLQDGKCADQGYTTQTGTKTLHVPVIGDITVTEYSKAGMMVEDTCSLYEISGATCGQSDLACKYSKYAKAFQKGLQDGKCADQGYTTQTGTKTLHVPVIGDITVTEYSKASMMVEDTC